MRNYLVFGRFLVSSQQESVLHWNLGSRLTNAWLQKREPVKESLEDLDQNLSRIVTENDEMSIEKSVVKDIMAVLQRYVNGTATQAQLQISLKSVIKSRKSSI